MKPVRLAAAVLAVGVVTGCASTATTDALMKEIEAAQATAQTALDTAKAANAEAIKAKTSAIKANSAAAAADEKATAAKTMSETNRSDFTEMLDRMFKKSMLK